MAICIPALKKTGLFFAAGLILIAGCRQKPRELPGLLARASIEMENDDIGAARDTLIEAAAMHPRSVTAHVNLGLAYWRLGDLTAAVAALNRATEITPGNPHIWELLGQLLLESQNADGAQEVLSRIKKPSVTAITLKAIAAMQTGDTDTARQQFENALALNRFYPPALYHLAVLYRDHLNTPVDALATYRRFRETAPDHPLAAKEDPVFLSLGPAAGTEDPLPDAPPPIRQPSEAAPTAPPATQAPSQPPPLGTEPTPAQAVRRLLANAESAAAAGDHDTALLTLKNTVQAYPENADAVWALAVFYERQLGMKDRASGLYKTFLNLFPNDPRAATLRTAAPSASPARTTSADQFFRTGLEHYNRQAWDASIADYRQALTLDPKFASCAYNLGLAYKGKGDLDSAAAAFRLALNIEPDMIKSLFMLGLTEIDRGRHANALAHLNRLISVQPDFAKAHYLLGSVYQTEKRPDMAAIHFERFLDLDPADSAAPPVRRWMEQYRRRTTN